MRKELCQRLLDFNFFNKNKKNVEIAFEVITRCLSISFFQKLLTGFKSSFPVPSLFCYNNSGFCKYSL